VVLRNVLQRGIALASFISSVYEAMKMYDYFSAFRVFINNSFVTWVFNRKKEKKWVHFSID